jgi:hypothetical protein
MIRRRQRIWNGCATTEEKVASPFAASARFDLKVASSAERPLPDQISICLMAAMRRKATVYVAVA